MKLLKLFSLGSVVVSIYVLLFIYEKEVINLCKQGGWGFLFPVSVAFLISIFHGAFTGLFWDVLGIKPKQSK